MNSIVGGYLAESFFPYYQALRDELMEILTDDDLGVRLGGETMTFGALCREMGEVEFSYIESFRTFRLDFEYRNPDPRLDLSVAALKAWFAELDRDLMAALEALSDDDITNRGIRRGATFAPLPAQQLDIYREALLIFYAKASVYLRVIGKPLSELWLEWIG